MTKKKIRKRASRIVVISDTQAPFHHPDTISFLRAIKRKYKPTNVVHIGDEVDFHALSEHDHDPDGMSASSELAESLIFMRQLYRLFPKVKACVSNHTSRPFRKAYKYGLPKAFIRSYSEFLEAPAGWIWADHHVISGIRFEHGEAYSGIGCALKHAVGNQQSTVIGHHHSEFGIEYRQTPNGSLFGMSVGCLIDDEAYAFAYNKKQKARPVLGVGIILNGVPQLIPMELNAAGRWNKKL